MTRARECLNPALCPLSISSQLKMIELSCGNVTLAPARTIVSTRVIVHVKGSNHLLKMLLLQFVLGHFDVFSMTLVTSALIPHIVITQWDIYS